MSTEFSVGQSPVFAKFISSDSVLKLYFLWLDVEEQANETSALYT